MKVFIERPVATAMVYLALLILGVYSFLNTPLELAPGEDFPQIDIETAWPGVSPEIVQSQVTAPLEEISSGVRGVRKVTSESQIGFSRITLEIDPKVNMEFARLALREAIAQSAPRLPYGLRPFVQAYVPEDFRVRPFFSSTISGNYTLEELRSLLKEKLELGLGAIKGVARVEVSGGSASEIRIVFNENRLRSLDIQPFQVNYAIDQCLRTYPAGRIRSSGREYIFKVANSVQAVSDLGRILVGHSGDAPIRLSDVADIVPAYGDVYEINRINGQPTALLTIHKEKGANTISVAREIKRRLERIKAELPKNLVFKTVDDESVEIGKNLKHLALLAVIITILVFLMIFVVLRSLVPSLLILSSIAFSVVITFNLIYILKIPLNMLTLGALALGFGIFVDDSIVVFENILRLRETGMEPVRAALQGAKEVFIPVLASTLTTVSVFFCFPYFQGRLKLYYLPLAFVMSSALAASLLVSFSLIPALSPVLLKINPVRKKGGRRGTFFPAFQRFTLRHPVGIVLVAAGILFGSYKWFRSEVSLGDFFRWYSKERLMVSIGMPPGTDIAKTDAVVKKFEDRTMEAGYEKEMNANISAEQAFISISFPPAVERSYRPYVLKEELIRLATQFAGISVGIYGFDPQGYYSPMEAGTYYDSRIKFYGYNLKKLKDITDDLEKSLRRHPRIKDIRTFSNRYGWWRVDSLEYVLRVDREALRKYDLDPQYLYFHIQALLPGRFSTLARTVLDGRETDISLKFPESDAMDVARLQDSLIKTGGGEFLRLREISKLEEKAVAGSIDRENQQFQQTVMWEFLGPYKAAEKYKNAVFEALKLPPGFSATLEEEWRMTEEEKGQMKFAVIFAVIVITMILAALYESLIQPFIILLSVPLAMIGVFAAFVIAGYPFDSSAYIGVILMAGIVVKNAILVVDHTNLKKKQGFPLAEAVLEGTRERIRPILMTTGTTIFGMLPLLLIPIEVGRRNIWSSLALCTAGGLTSSTIFVLIIIPIFYIFGEKLRPWLSRKAAEIHTFRHGDGR